MKISKLFHWLYATLLFLPLLVAPIFGIYSHRHTIDSYSVTTPQNKVVDFNQLVRNGNFNNTDYWLNISDIYNTLTSVDNTLKVDVLSTDMARYFYVAYNILDDIKVGDKYLLRFNLVHNDYSALVVELGGDNQQTFTSYSNSSIFEVTNIYNNQLLFFPSSVNDVGYYQIANVNLFNLTQMFGNGNEPTLEQFNSWYSDDYYFYTLSHKELLQVGTITYDNTDIGSQFIYTIYGTLDKYFNMSNLLPFNGLSEWLQVNIFNGNFSLGFYIFYNLFLYWFLISLLWLIFDVLMYVPNLAHRWLDRSSLQ